MGGANGKIAASVRVLPIRVVGYKGGVGAPRLAPGSRYAARLRGLWFIWVLIPGLAPWATLCRPPARACFGA